MKLHSGKFYKPYKKREVKEYRPDASYNPIKCHLCDKHTFCTYAMVDFEFVPICSECQYESKIRDLDKGIFR